MARLFAAHGDILLKDVVLARAMAKSNFSGNTFGESVFQAKRQCTTQHPD